MAIDELLEAVLDAFEAYEEDEGARWRRRRHRPGRRERRVPPRWPAPHPGPLPQARCPDERRIALQRQVHPFCDTGDRICEDYRGRPATNSLCRELIRRAARNRRCLGIRQLLNRECFGGGDRTHRREARLASQALNSCREIYRSSGCVQRLGGRDFFEDAY